MVELFKAKIRKVGTSLGVLIPKEFADKEKIREGEEIEITLLKEKRIDEILKLIGTAKIAKSFERDRINRIDRWQ